ncbi:MAG: hypothetical protein AAGF84_02260 [Planctomycetota bacterium]
MNIHGKRSGTGAAIAAAVLALGPVTRASTFPSISIDMMPGQTGLFWDDPASWAGGLIPDDFTQQAFVTANLWSGSNESNARLVFMDQFHTVTGLTSTFDDPASDRRPMLTLRNDLRVMETMSDVSILIQDGKDLILGGIGLGNVTPPSTTVKNVQVRNLPDPDFPERTPRFTLAGPARFSGLDFDGSDYHPPSDTIPMETPGLVWDGDFIATLSGTNTFRGYAELRPEEFQIVGGSTRFLARTLGGSDRFDEGGALDTELLVQPGPANARSEVVWTDVWRLGPNGSIDLGNNDLILDSVINENWWWYPGSFTDSPTLEFDLSRLTVGPEGVVTVRDSLDLKQYRELKSSGGSVRVSQSANRLGVSGPRNATDLLGQTIGTAELRGVNREGRLPTVLPSSFVLANGTLTAPTPGGPVTDLQQISYLYDVTVDGGLDITDWIITDGPNPFVQRFGNVTIANGMLEAQGFKPIDANDRVRIQVGELGDIVDSPTDVPGNRITFRDAGLAEHLELDVYGAVVVEGGFQLDGTLLLAQSSDNSTEITFQGGVELMGIGTLIGPTGPLGLRPEHAILVRDGDLTIGSGVSIFSNGAPTTRPSMNLDAEGHAVFVDGRLRFFTLTNAGAGVTRATARELRVRQGSLELLGNFALDAEALAIEDQGTLEIVGPRNTNDHAAPMVDVSGIASLGGTLSMGLSGLVELGDEVPLIRAASVTGRFNRIADTTPTNAIPEGSAWAVVYEAAAVRAVLALIGDADLNGQVEQGDLNAVLTNWGRNNPANGSSANNVTWVDGDFDGNGTIDQSDLNAVLTAWGSAAAPSFALNPTVVPEPGVAAMGLVSLGVGLDRRRRTLRA